MIKADHSDLPIQESAMIALQEAAEAHLIHRFEIANAFAMAGRREIVILRDMLLAQDFMERKRS